MIIGFWLSLLLACPAPVLKPDDSSADDTGGDDSGGDDSGGGDSSADDSGGEGCDGSDLIYSDHGLDAANPLGVRHL